MREAAAPPASAAEVEPRLDPACAARERGGAEGAAVPAQPLRKRQLLAGVVDFQVLDQMRNSRGPLRQPAAGGARAARRTFRRRKVALFEAVGWRHVGHLQLSTRHGVSAAAQAEQRQGLH